MIVKVQSTILTAALYGYARAQTGCYPAYISGGPYIAGQWVSATTITAETTTAACTLGTAGCGANGFKTETTETTETYNYQCREGASSAFCSNAGFAPGGLYSDSAWDKESTQCSGNATPAEAPAPAAWSGGGCPAAYSAGTAYEAGDVVSVTQGTFAMAYQCAEEPANQWCGMAGYEPGEGTAWEQAWTALGSCDGTMAPTLSPSFDALADAGGCPGEYAEGADYEEGDRVARAGFVFQCKSWPNSEHCSQAGYEPGVDSAAPDAWKDAWDVVGYCSGTIAPTSSPIFVALESIGGCPDVWESKALGDAYEEGDQVSSNGLVFACKSWPHSAHCGQNGYEPNNADNQGTPNAWKDAWSVVGYCSGSMGPTSSPTFDAVASVGACPDEWGAGSNTAYEEGDMVSVTVSESPLRKVAYTCKAWPYSGNCGQFSPTHEAGGSLGWTLAGSCDGSTGPTASPSFDNLAVDANGCPPEYSLSTTDYEAGDQVSVTVSTTPERKVMYQCREWPHNSYCNQSGFQPGVSRHDYMAWTLVGACTGTLSPTASPAAYSGTCQYSKCVMTDDTEQCDPGSNGCSCNANDAAGPGCLRDISVEVCTDTTVGLWSSNANYVTNDVVRVGTQRFKCREWPNYLWCGNSAYKPQSEEGIWSQAWTLDGVCD